MMNWTKDPELLLNVAKYYFLAGDHQKSLDYLDKLKGQVKDPIIDRMIDNPAFGVDEKRHIAVRLPQPELFHSGNRRPGRTTIIRNFF